MEVFAKMKVAALVALLAAGLAVGVEVCLYGRTPGLGWLVFVVAVGAAVMALAHRLERHPPAWVRVLWVAPALLAGAVAAHDSHVIQGAAPLLCVLSLVLCTYWTLAGPVAFERFAWAPLPMVATPIHAVGQARRGVRELDLPARTDVVWRALKGVAMAAPLVGAFGLLFASSDRLYADLLSQAASRVGWDFGMPAFRIAILGLVLLGLLRALAWPASPPPAPAQEGRPGDPLVLGVMLGTVNLLFASFLAVQAQYLFAGRAAMLVPDLTWAEYVHRGFFELVAATLLVLGVTWGAFRQSHRQSWPLALAVLLILQTYGVAASAMTRLWLYMEAYGLTVLRVYVAASMVGICLILALVALAAATRQSFAWLASRTAFALVLLTALTLSADVEGFVARTNVAHVPAAEVDVEYLGTLSADVVPAVRTLLESEDLAVRQRAEHALALLAARVEPERMLGWQSFNLSRQRALAVR